MAKATHTTTRVLPAAEIAAMKQKLDRYEGLAVPIIEVSQMAHLAVGAIEDTLDRIKPFDPDKPDLVFIDQTYRASLVFAAQHLQDMIDDFKKDFFEVLDDNRPQPC